MRPLTRRSNVAMLRSNFPCRSQTCRAHVGCARAQLLHQRRVGSPGLRTAATRPKLASFLHFSHVLGLHVRTAPVCALAQRPHHRLLLFDAPAGLGLARGLGGSPKLAWTTPQSSHSRLAVEHTLPGCAFAHDAHQRGRPFGLPPAFHVALWPGSGQSSQRFPMVQM